MWVDNHSLYITSVEYFPEFAL